MKYKKVFLDMVGYQFNKKNAHMAEKEIILYGKNNVLCCFFTLGESAFFQKEHYCSREPFFVWKPTIHFITKVKKKVATQYKHKQQNTNFLFPAFSKESSLNCDQGNRIQEE